MTRSTPESHNPPSRYDALTLGGVRAHDRSGRSLLDVQSLRVSPGECVGIVGSSGSGKSLLVRAAIGLPPQGIRYSVDRWSVGGTDLMSASDSALSRVRGDRIGYVGQDALGGLDPLRTIQRELGDVLRLHDPTHTANTERLAEALRSVGLTDTERILRSRSEQLSGGQRQRVLIAAAMLCSPELIIADEATTAIDTVSQRRVLNSLVQAQRTGTAIVLVSHDLAVVAEYADRILVMSDGRIVEEGTTDHIVSAPQHPVTQALIAAASATASPTGAPSSPSTPSTPSTGSPTSAMAPAMAPVPPALTADALTATHPGAGEPTIRDLSLQLNAGQTLGLIGSSGSGKSTLARVVLGLLPPQQGTVTLDGSAWVPGPEKLRRPRRSLLAAVSQDPHASFDPRLTVGALLRSALAGRSLSRSDRDASTVQLLRDVALDPSLRLSHPDQLSGGQRQRVAIACALASSPRVLICDEAVTALDATVRAGILDLLRDLQQRLGMAILFISHDLAVVRKIADHLAVIDAGRIVEHGPTERVLSHAAHPATRALRDAEPPPLADRIRHGSP
ncbi:MAG: ATP-binding cassette domain-containing protein [Mycetocola sp.]